MKNVKRLSYSILLSLILTLTLSSVSFASYDDVGEHWANEQITRWSDNGVVQGSNNKFRPTYNISRAEVATILDNVMKYQKKSSNNFVDLKDTWYTDAMLKSAEADIFKGYESNIRPEDNITREETAIVFARAFDLGSPQGQSSKFTDEKKISSWAKDSVNAMEERGYMEGYDDKFRPQDNITRAEVVKLLDNVIERFYNKPGTYSENIDGIVVINNSQVELKDSNIDGDVIVSEGVSKGNFKLNNVYIYSSLKVNSFRTVMSIDSSYIEELRIIGQYVSIYTNSKTNIDTIYTDKIGATINEERLKIGETVLGSDYIGDDDAIETVVSKESAHNILVAKFDSQRPNDWYEYMLGSESYAHNSQYVIDNYHIFSRLLPFEYVDDHGNIIHDYNAADHNYCVHKKTGEVKAYGPKAYGHNGFLDLNEL